MASFLDDVLTTLSGVLPQKEDKRSVMDPNRQKDQALKDLIPAMFAGIGQAIIPQSPTDFLPGIGSLLAGSGEAEATIGGAQRIKGLQTALDAARMLGKGVDKDAVYNKLGVYEGPLDKELRAVISDANMKMSRRLQAGDSLKLGDFIKHDELFKHYPELKDIKIQGQELQRGTKGMFDHSSNRLILDTKYQSNDEMQSTMLHEIQHAIQGIENFTTGSNPQSMARHPDFLKAMGDGNYLQQVAAQKSASGDTRSVAAIVAQKLYELVGGEAEARAVEAQYKKWDWNTLPTKLYDVDPKQVIKPR